MQRILDVIASETKGSSFNSYKYSYDRLAAPTPDYKGPSPATAKDSPGFYLSSVFTRFVNVLFMRFGREPKEGYLLIS
jgi:hypothetical protein